MKPLDILSYYQNSKLDLIADQVLHRLCDFKRGIQTNLFVHECYINGISSQATTYAKLEMLEKLGLITKTIDETDTRVRMLAATENGHNRIKGWGKK